jgi:hypothetical protein
VSEVMFYFLELDFDSLAFDSFAFSLFLKWLETIEVWLWIKLLDFRLDFAIVCVLRWTSISLRML